jgi:hypothetical protein
MVAINTSFYDPLGQKIKSEEITTGHTEYTEFLMLGMVEQARSEISNLML